VIDMILPAYLDVITTWYP